MRKLRGFCTAFTVTMCILGLGVGLFVVGYNSRRMAQGDSVGTYRLENGKFKLTDQNGNEMTLAPVDEQQTTAPLTPAPLRVTLHFLRGVAAAAETLAERLSG